MTATVVAVVPLTRAVQYDGTNSADIDAAIDDFTIIMETGGTLTFESNGGQHAVPTNGHIIFNQTGVVIEAVADGYYNDYYQEIPDPAAVTALEENVDALPDSIEGVGVATFGAIVATQSADVPVTLMPAMPDSDYQPAAQLFGGTNLGALAITAIDVVDADTVTVTVQNNGLVSLGASVLVTATAN